MSSRLPLRLASLVLASPAVTAQLFCDPCPNYSGAGYNTVRFHNETVGAPVEFPNFRKAGGNVEGDALWRVFPKELHWRASPGNCVVGFELPFKFNNWQQNTPFYWGGMELRRVKTIKEKYKVPDFDAYPFYQALPKGLPTPVFPADYYWFRKTFFDRGSYPAIGHEDVALVILAPPGISERDANGYMGWHTKGERYVNAPQPSFSGTYNAVTRTFEFLVPPFTSEATELSAGISFHGPVLEFAATTSGGGSRQQGETHFGIGAFYNDLATRGGEWRIRSEFNWLNGGASVTFGVPLLGLRRAAPTAFLPGNECLLDHDLADPFLTTLLAVGQYKAFQERFRNNQSWETFYESDWMPFPADPALKGAQLLFGVAAYSAWANRFHQTANSVMVRFD